MNWLVDEMLAFPTVIYAFLLISLALVSLLNKFGLIAVDFNRIQSTMVRKLSGPFSELQNGESVLRGFIGFTVIWAFVVSLVLSAWVIPQLAVQHSHLSLVLDVLVFISALGLALPLTRLSSRIWAKPAPEVMQQQQVRPSPQPAEVKPMPSQVDLVGCTCHVTSGTVTERIGEAECERYGTTQIIAVRSQAFGRLRRGDAVLVTEYDPEREIYWVEPYQDPFA